MGTMGNPKRSEALESLIRGVEPDLYARACRYHRERAPGFGSRASDAKEHQALWDVSYDLSDAAFELQGVAREARLQLLFELYEEMPAYMVLSAVDWVAQDLDAGSRGIVWNWYRMILSRESPELVDPLSYWLWCGAFEGSPESTAAAWRGIIGEDPTDLLLDRLLRISGPVAWEAKVETYKRLAADPAWHVRLAHALLACFYDAYGDNDIEEAMDLLESLKLPPDSEEAMALEILGGNLHDGVSTERQKFMEDHPEWRPPATGESESTGD